MADAKRQQREMMVRDRASAMLGMVVERDDPGHAIVSMRLRDDMMNGHDITHGGFVFSLADTAFAICCNDDVTITVAAGADITFLKPTTVGQTLTATAVQRVTRGRTGVCDVTVTDETGDVVAEFRGRSFRPIGHCARDRGAHVGDPARTPWLRPGRRTRGRGACVQ